MPGMCAAWRVPGRSLQPLKWLSKQATVINEAVKVAAVLPSHHPIVSTATLWLPAHCPSCVLTSAAAMESSLLLVTSALLPAACGALKIGWPTRAPSRSLGRWWGQRWQLWWGVSRPRPPQEVSLCKCPQLV